ALGCGDDDPTGPGGNGGGNIYRATIDGASWSAVSSTIQVTGGIEPRLGTIVISGGNTSGDAVILTLSFIGGTGTYPLGVNPGTNAGGSGSVFDSPNTWLTPLSGAAGSVVITTRTATRIAGTFEFTAEPLGASGADVVVTGGEFDITIDAGLPALPTGGGSVMTATVDGQPWNGATITQVSNGSSFGGATTEFTIGFVGAVAPGVFNLGVGAGQWQCQIQRVGTSDSWATTSSDSVGTITFVTVLPGRMQGLFTGTIPPLGASDSLAVTNGFFSIYLP
ncbi:MAG TPA: DUF6252 family protein, partial [Candidatus Udaeobacter sp.]|nr:DUF6252 family protein [Candidatus Udaeobacter sp.]